MATNALLQEAPPEEQQEGQAEEVQAPVNNGLRAPCEDYGQTDVAKDDKTLQGYLRECCKHWAQLDQYPRRTEVIEARRQRFYRRGDQYILTNKEGIFQPWTGSSDEGEAQDDGRLTDVYNIFWPYMRAMIALGTQNPAGVNFEPDDGTRSTDITAARNSEIYRHQVDRTNKRKDLQGDIFSLFCTDTRTVLYTRCVWDAQRFGTNDDGLAKFGEVISAAGTLETKLNITAENLGETPYFIWTDDPDECMAKEQYPGNADEIHSGISAIGESAYERFARLGVLQGAKTMHNAADAYGHLTVRHRIWLRPAAFRYASEEIRAELTEKYPKGCKVVWCGDAYCGSYDQSMDSHITVGFPGPGDGMARSSMMKDMVALQDAYNDYRNMEKELYEHCIPMSFRNSELMDMDAERERRSEWGNMTAVQVPAGLDINQCFYFEPKPECPASLVEAYNNLMGALAQFISGAQPALFGQADKNNDTASGISMLRDQAMGQFGIAWGNFQEMMASAYSQAVLAAANARGDDAVVPVSMVGKRGKSLIAQANLGAIKKGNFHCHPDSDSSFPETTGSKRQVIQNLVTQALANPEAADAFGVLKPANLEIQRQALAIPDWFIPAADACDKQMGEIELLLKQRPVPQMQKVQEFAADLAMEKLAAAKAQGTGIPVPDESKPDPNQMYESSIPVNVAWDFHQYEYETIKDWLSSPEGLEETKTNVWGILNVRCHGQEHQEAMQAQAPPMMPSMPTGPAKPPQLPSPGAQMHGAPRISPGGPALQ